MSDLAPLLTLFDLAACAVFAVTGALVASRKGMDIVGHAWLGVATGIGGGTLRDLLLGVPVFWMQDTAPLLACMAGAMLTYFAATRLYDRFRAILWCDALGLALFVVAGTLKGLDVGASSLVAVTMGVITGTVGGILRDLLAQEPSVVMRREIYVTAALVGATACVVVHALTGDRASAAAAGFVVVFLVRGLAIARGWSLPVRTDGSG